MWQYFLIVKTYREYRVFVIPQTWTAPPTVTTRAHFDAGVSLTRSSTVGLLQVLSTEWPRGGFLPARHQVLLKIACSNFPIVFWLQLIKIMYVHKIYEVNYSVNFYNTEKESKVSGKKCFCIWTYSSLLPECCPITWLILTYRSCKTCQENIPSHQLLVRHCFMCVCSIRTCPVLEPLTMYWDHAFSWLTHSLSYEQREERGLALFATERSTQTYTQYLLNKHYF